MDSGVSTVTAVTRCRPYHLPMRSIRLLTRVNLTQSDGDHERAGSGGRSSGLKVQSDNLLRATATKLGI